MTIISCQERVNENNEGKITELLKHLLETYNSVQDDGMPHDVPIWESWLRRTGELPHDFDELQINTIPPKKQKT